MRNHMFVAYMLAAVIASPALAEPYSIPPEKLDDQKIFWGTASSFEKPAELNYQRIVQTTPEYKSIKRKKVESGTAKYWILISRASDHAVRVINEVGQETGYDFIAAEGYLGSLDPPIKAENITDLVLEKIKDER